MLKPYSDLISFAEAGHVYRYDGQPVPHITGVAPSDYSMVPPDKLAHAAWRGGASHTATEEYDRGIVDYTKLHREVEPRLEAWDRFLRDPNFDVHFTLNAIEPILYHPLYGYGGRGDRAPVVTDEGVAEVYIRGRLSVLEIKTIAAMDEHVGYQLAGQAEEINHWRRLSGLPLIEERWAVQLRADGSPHPVQYSKPSDRSVFLAYLTILKEDVSLGKRGYYANHNNDPKRQRRNHHDRASCVTSERNIDSQRARA